MKSKILRVLFALVALFCVSPVMSQKLVFHHPDGSLSEVALPATLSITPSGDKLVIESGSTRFEIEKERILAMTYQSAKGDVNDDMTVNVADIVTVVNIISGGSPGTGGGKAPASAEAVDLGLPSGLKWANMNVGASKPEDYGDYFAWGETTTKDIYSWESYKWCNGSSRTLKKYCSNSEYGGYNGFTDSKTVLDIEDDAARANWGGDWRMPTNADFEELIANTTNEWTTQNGVNGYKFTSKTNGNSIFLPAAGYRWSDGLDLVGLHGDYWSSSLGESYTNLACYLYFGSEVVGTNNGGRDSGTSVRPVR